MSNVSCHLEAFDGRCELLHALVRGSVLMLACPHTVSLHLACLGYSLFPDQKSKQFNTI